MKRPPRDQEREQRITMEIIVDAYGPEEQAMGWYYYGRVPRSGGNEGVVVMLSDDARAGR
jgi:hypothetical protein